MEAYQQFRSLYETARFEEALPYAKRVVELSEQDAERDHELPIAYNNLGATQYQLADYTGANASYTQSLELLEATQGISSRRLVVPLAGLGAVYAAQDQHEVAAELFDRALAVSRRADGLFNLQQLPLIAQAADSRYAINDFGGSERERMYALKVAEQNYGYGDERTIPPLLDLAVFYEGLREYIAARMMYLRARDVAMQKGGYSAPAVKALVGIARTHRMQYTMDPETLDSQQPARDEVTGEMVGKVYRESRVPPPAADRSGLKSAQVALELLRSTSDPPKDLMTETLIELGDWFQSTSRPTISMPYYAEAAGIFDAVVAADPLMGHPLKAPRMVFYRPPVSASRGLNTLSGQYVIRKTVFSFLVTEAGLPEEMRSYPRPWMKPRFPTRAARCRRRSTARAFRRESQSRQRVSRSRASGTRNTIRQRARRRRTRLPTANRRPRRTQTPEPEGGFSPGGGVEPLVPPPAAHPQALLQRSALREEAARRKSDSPRAP